MFPTAGSYFLLALGFMAFGSYVSLLPFELHWVEPASALEQFREALLSTPPRISRSDILANTLLFVPIGFTLAGAVLVDRRGAVRHIVALVAIATSSIAVSAFNEFLQIYASDRVPSRFDVAAQTAGCVAGIIAWIAAGDAATQRLRRAIRSTAGDRLLHVLGAYATAWVFVALAPFDITLDLGDLAARFRSGEISLVPFGGAERTLIERAWDGTAETISALPLGGFVAVAFNRRARPASGALASGVALVIAAEMAQVFIGSHAADVTDAMFGGIGVAIGAWAAGRTLGRDQPGLVAASANTASWWGVAGFAAASLLAVLYHWQPFDFAVDEELIRRKLARISLLPFAGYLSGSYLNAFNDFLTKVALSLPVGVAAAFSCGRPSAGRLVLTASVATFALLFGIIEAGQFFLSTRIPDPTDVLVGMLGAGVGLWIVEWLRGGHAEHLKNHPLGSRDQNRKDHRS